MEKRSNPIAQALIAAQQQQQQQPQGGNPFDVEGLGMQPPMAMPGQNPMALDPALEQAAAPGNIPMHPLVRAIATKLGLMSMARNRSNQQMLDPESPYAQ